MRTHLRTAAMILTTVSLCEGCESTTYTVRRTLTPSGLAEAGKHAVAVTRVRRGSVQLRSGTAGPVALQPGDVVDVTLSFNAGDVIPGEGVVRQRVSLGLIIAGAVATAVGGAGIAAAVLGCPQSSGFLDIGSGICRGYGGIFAGTIAVTGLAMLGFGAQPTHFYIDKTKVSLAPTLLRGGAGGAIAFQF